MYKLTVEVWFDTLHDTLAARAKASALGMREGRVSDYSHIENVGNDFTVVSEPSQEYLDSTVAARDSRMKGIHEMRKIR